MKSSVLRRLPLLPALLTLLLGPGALAQSLDLSGWQVVQANSSSIYTLPGGTAIEPGGYLVLGRFASRSEFEAYYGVTLATNVLYFTNAVSSSAVPMINGDEVYRVLDGGGATVDGPTPAITSVVGAHHRTDPEADPWTAEDDVPTPGFGVEAQDAVFSGVVISEVVNPADYYYEYVELYYDADAGTGTNQPPVIWTVAASPAEPQVGDDLTVSSTITDPDGTIDLAVCYWRSAEGAFSALTMSWTGAAYEAVIADLPGNVTIDYYVWCRDDAGAITVSPAGAPASFLSVWVQGTTPVGKVVLFDHAHDQDAGSNGNWRIDDNFPDPYPAVPSSETSWSGQLSTWGFELYQAGHTVRSTTALLSTSVLAGVDLLVIPEPQNPFTAAEIEAVRQFVFGGGALFFVADHNSSDRNGNGWDSPSIFGGYTTPHITEPVGSDVETFCGALFGLHVHVKDEGDNSISGAFDNLLNDAANPVLHGPYGEVTGVYYHVGNVMSLWPTANAHLSDVGGLISKDAGSPHVLAWSRYGAGKVLGYGDSSSMADGTDSETHENNWTEASHREVFLNGSTWLLTSDANAVGDVRAPFGVALRTWPNPFNPSVTIEYSLPAAGRAQVDVFDAAGRKVRSLVSGDREAGPHTVSWQGRDDAGRPLPSGVYLVRAVGAGAVNVSKVVLAK